jgi:hypothetical protein
MTHNEAIKTIRHPFYDVERQTLRWADAQGNVWEREFVNGVWKEAWIMKELAVEPKDTWGGDE